MGDHRRVVSAAQSLGEVRHHGLYRRGPRSPWPPRCAPVLNAFRHHGLYRSYTNLRRILTSGAQRLSASRIISAWISVLASDFAPLCSTPFGITDYIGGGCGAAARRQSFWCSTPFGITDYIGQSGGRRFGYVSVLNAFRHHGLYRWRRCRPRTCTRRSAQRLSASRIISEGRWTWEEAALHMCSTPFGITDYIGPRAVTCIRCLRYLCSTPFGITDYIGFFNSLHTSAVTLSAQRLSASRIISVSANDEWSLTDIWCSTPFGITDYIGRPWKETDDRC